MIMKIKRTIPLLALLSAAMLTPLVYAADGNINITGRVLESACNIATSSKDMTIEMGEVNRSMFSSIGDGSPEKIFDLEIECGASSLVGIRLEGKASDANPDVFALDEISGAKGIGLKLITRVNGDERVAKPNGRPTFHYQIPWNQQHNKQWARFYAQYVSVGDNISGGSGNTMLQVSLDYL
ncbi:type 1 fimbrial protein [Serratia marcescens]|nr:ferrous iron transporter B [Serratia marcescens]